MSGWILVVGTLLYGLPVGVLIEGYLLHAGAGVSKKSAAPLILEVQPFSYCANVFGEVLGNTSLVFVPPIRISLTFIFPSASV